VVAKAKTSHGKDGLSRSPMMGPGIPLHDTNRFFKRFYRSNPAARPTGKRSGVSLGRGPTSHIFTAREIMNDASNK